MSERRPKRAPQRMLPPPRASSGYPAPPPREGPSEGKRGPQRAPRETPRAGVLAAHEGAPPVLRDSAPGLPKKGPPWDIEGELGGSKDFALKRPSEADSEGDAAGHLGYHKNKPGRIKTSSVPAVPQISKDHLPWGRTRHPDPPPKTPDVFVLRPIERARAWNWRRRWQRGHLNLNMSRPRHARHARLNALHAGRIPSRAPRIKEDFPSLHGRGISPQSPDCARNEGECRTHRVRARAPVFARARSCFCLVLLDLLVDYHSVLDLLI